MEHGLKDIAFYVQKHITPWTVVISSLLVREKALGAPASVKRVYSPWLIKNVVVIPSRQGITHWLKSSMTPSWRRLTTANRALWDMEQVYSGICDQLQCNQRQRSWYHENNENYWSLVRENHRWPTDCHYKGPVMWDAFLCHGVSVFVPHNERLDAPRKTATETPINGATESAI